MKPRAKCHRRGNKSERSFLISFFLTTPLFAFLGLAALVSCSTPLQWSQVPESIGSTSLAGWLGDMDQLETEMGKHPRLNAVPEAEASFALALDEARASLETADPEDLEYLASVAITGIAKALAAVGDGHTRINASSATVFPLIVKAFPTAAAGEGIGALESATGWEYRIAATDAEHGSILGQRVVSVGGLAATEAFARIAQTCSIEAELRSGQASALLPYATRSAVMNSLADPWLMRGLGFAEGGNLSVDLRDENGVESTIIFQERDRPTSWVRVLDSATLRPFTRSGPSKPWWFGSPEDRKDILYFRYDSCDRDALAIIEEMLALLPDMDSGEEGPSYLIVDLRYNSGGDSRPGSYLARNLRGKAVAGKKGGVIVLAGQATYSSAMMNLADILKSCGATGAAPGNALLVGEPLVEPLRHYGEVTRFQLGNSGLVIGRSRRLWRYDLSTGIRPVRGILEPEPGNVVVQPFSHYAEGRDDGFERALELAPQAPALE